MLPLRSLGRKSLIVNLHAQARHKEHITAEPCSHIAVKNSCVTEKLSRMMRSIDGRPARLANLHLKLLMARYIANRMQARVLSCINNHDNLSNTFSRSTACNSWQLFLCDAFRIDEHGFYMLSIREGRLRTRAIGLGGQSYAL